MGNLELKKGDRLKVLVKPSKPFSRLLGFDSEGRLLAEVDAPPVAGKANLALIKLFKREGFNVILEKGHSAKVKSLRVI